eukprot:30154-Pelagococcus_subviridis.AAC.3
MSTTSASDAYHGDDVKSYSAHPASSSFFGARLSQILYLIASPTSFAHSIASHTATSSISAHGWNLYVGRIAFSASALFCVLTYPSPVSRHELSVVHDAAVARLVCTTASQHNPETDATRAVMFTAALATADSDCSSLSKNAETHWTYIAAGVAGSGFQALSVPAAPPLDDSAVDVAAAASATSADVSSRTSAASSAVSAAPLASVYPVIAPDTGSVIKFTASVSAAVNIAPDATSFPSAASISVSGTATADMRIVTIHFASTASCSSARRRRSERRRVEVVASQMPREEFVPIAANVLSHASSSDAAVCCVSTCFTGTPASAASNRSSSFATSFFTAAGGLPAVSALALTRAFIASLSASTLARAASAASRSAIASSHCF